MSSKGKYYFQSYCRIIGSSAVKIRSELGMRNGFKTVRSKSIAKRWMWNVDTDSADV